MHVEVVAAAFVISGLGFRVSLGFRDFGFKLRHLSRNTKTWTKENGNEE